MPAPPTTETPPSVEGLAHVGTVSFLAGRVSPVGAFWLSLAGGVALARIGAREGPRRGYGAALAVLTETVAVMGPARVSAPLTQALSAPLLGAMHARGRSAGALLATCLAIRMALYAISAVFFVLVIVGGPGAYVDSYDRIVELTGGWLPSGATAAVLAGVAGNLAAAGLFTGVQVAVYRRGLAEEDAAHGAPTAAHAAPARDRAPRRLVLGAWAVAATWVLLLALPAWPVLGAIGAAVLAGTVALGRERRGPMRVGAGLGLVLALGALGPGLLGALPLEEAASRAVRALLLVTSAALLQSAARPDGIRRLVAGALVALRRVPSTREAAALAPILRADRRVLPASLDLVGRVRAAAPSPRAVTVAVVTWVGDEARRGPA